MTRVAKYNQKDLLYPKSVMHRGYRKSDDDANGWDAASASECANIQKLQKNLYIRHVSIQY